MLEILTMKNKSGLINITMIIPNIPNMIEPIVPMIGVHPERSKATKPAIPTTTNEEVRTPRNHLKSNGFVAPPRNWVIIKILVELSAMREATKNKYNIKPGVSPVIMVLKKIKAVIIPNPI